MLIVFGGLPGTGKTTLSRRVAEHCRATYLRIDVIEQALRSTGTLTDDVGPNGYVVANALAASNLQLGQTVVADAVNPVPIAREGWHSVAAAARCPILEIEVVCSDEAEHRHRVESRVGDISGLVLPSWAAVLARHYEPWPKADLVIDTARTSPEEAVRIIVNAIEERGGLERCRQ